MKKGLGLAALGALSACIGPTTGYGTGQTYQALGHDPAWTLTIRDGTIDFAGSDPQTLMRLVAPPPQPLPYGRRYTTERLTLEITSKPCNDARSGVGFSDTVVVLVDGYKHEGCGGERVSLLNI
jgi:uncharacterized membrane protein